MSQVVIEFTGIAAAPIIMPADMPFELLSFQRVHQAMIVQALQDLKTLSKKPECEKARADALAFFGGKGEWEGALEHVCDCAGWDVADVRRRVRKFIRESEVDFVELHKEQRIKRRRRIKRRPPLSAYICRSEMVHSPA